MLPFAQAVIKKEEDLKDAMMRHNAQQYSDSFESLSLYTMPYVSNSLFNLLEADIHDNNLDSCSIFELNFPEVITAIETNNSLALCNFCIEDLPLIKSNKNIKFTPLFKINLVVLGSKQLLSPGIKDMPPSLLATLPLAYYNDPILNKVVSHLFEEERFSNNKLILHTSNHQKIISLLHEGKAVTFSDTFSSYLVKRKNDIISIPLSPEVSIVIGFMISAHADKPCLQTQYIERFRSMINVRYGSYSKKYAFAQ